MSSAFSFPYFIFWKVPPHNPYLLGILVMSPFPLWTVPHPDTHFITLVLPAPLPLQRSPRSSPFICTYVCESFLVLSASHPSSLEITLMHRKGSRLSSVLCNPAPPHPTPAINVSPGTDTCPSPKDQLFPSLRVTRVWCEACELPVPTNPNGRSKTAWENGVRKTKAKDGTTRLLQFPVVPVSQRHPALPNYTLAH